ncbi:MAG: hypothetical protein IJS61_09890 [Firmicutes bacterium]|nr:hypothetical protein [Bacillota bacterium]
MKDEGGVVTQTPAQARTAENIGVSATSAVEEGKDQRVEVVNVAPHTLTVSKEVSGGFADRNREFSFTLQLIYEDTDGARPLQNSLSYSKNGEEGTLTLQNGCVTFRLKDSESIVFYNIPHGTIYTLTGQNGDYDTVCSLNEGADIEGNTVTDSILTDTDTVFKNNKNAVVPTGHFKPTKDSYIIGLGLLFGLMLLFIKRATSNEKQKGIF